MPTTPCALPAPNKATDDEKRHLARAQAGDSESFAVLCDRHRKRVWSIAASVTRNTADADDLAQDAILRAWKALPNFRADAPFEAWLCRIALHAARDWVGSAWKRRVFGWSALAGPDGSEPEIISDTATPHDEAELRETQKRVRQAVAKLRPQEQTPIWLLYFEGFSLADVARLENLPESTVRSRVKVGLRRLQSSLGDLVNLDGGDTAPPSPWKGCAI